jgi:hypothetical protein
LRALIGAARGAAQALDDARTAVALARGLKDSVDLHPALACNAAVAAELGEPEEADRLLDELRRAGASAPPEIVPMSVAVCARQRAAEFIELLDGLERRSPWHDAAHAMLRGDHAAAAERLATIGALPEEAYARLLAGEASAAAGKHAEARSQLGRCAPFFESVCAAAYLERVSTLRSSLAAGPAHERP